MCNMGVAAMEAAEKREYMIQKDIENGHKPGCSISYPPPSGGYCDCGKFKRGVSQYDPLYGKSLTTNEDGSASVHPFLHVCRKCLNLTRVVAIAMVVEVITFYPTHLLFERLGWM